MLNVPSHTLDRVLVVVPKQVASLRLKYRVRVVQLAAVVVFRNVVVRLPLVVRIGLVILC